MMEQLTAPVEVFPLVCSGTSLLEREDAIYRELAALDPEVVGRCSGMFRKAAERLAVLPAFCLLSPADVVARCVEYGQASRKGVAV